MPLWLLYDRASIDFNRRLAPLFLATDPVDGAVAGFGLWSLQARAGAFGGDVEA
jgi:hypothetical protein